MNTNLTKIDRANILYYMAQNNPSAFGRAMAMLRSEKNRGLNAVSTSSDTSTAQQAVDNSSWFDKALETLKAVGAYITTRDLAKINLERAKQGLSPISQDGIAPQVQVGMAPETRQLVTIGMFGLGAILILGMLRRR